MKTALSVNTELPTELPYPKWQQYRPPYPLDIQLPSHSVTSERDHYLKEFFLHKISLWNQPTSWHLTPEDRLFAENFIIRYDSYFARKHDDLLDLLESQEKPIPTKNMYQIAEFFLAYQRGWKYWISKPSHEWDGLYDDLQRDESWSQFWSGCIVS